jgi:hypothetical protein
MCSLGHGRRSARACAERRADAASLADFSERTHAAPQRESERAAPFLTSAMISTVCRASCTFIPLTPGPTASRPSAQSHRAFAARARVAPGAAYLCGISASVR